MNRVTKGLRKPRWQPTSESKRAHIEWFLNDRGPTSEADVVARVFFSNGLDDAFEVVRDYEKKAEQEQLDRLREMLLDGVRPVDEVKAELAFPKRFVANLPNPEPAEEVMSKAFAELDIRKVFGPPNWRERVAAYFGF